MSTSNTISSAAGNIQVEIGSNPDTFELISVSSIEYKFDINDITSDTISSVPFLIASCKVTVDNASHSSGSFEDSELGSVRDVEITIGGNGFTLEYRPTGAYTVDDMKGTVTFECIATDRTDTDTATFSDVFDNGSGTLRTNSASPIQQVLESALNDFGVSTYIIDTVHFDDSNMPASGAGPTVWAATIDDSQVISACAAVEGSYYGIGFDTGFYVQRDQTTNKVTLTQNDIDIRSVSRDISYPDLKDLDITFDNNDANNPFTGSAIFQNDSETVNAANRQTLSFTSGGNLIRVLYDDTDARLETDTSANADTAAQSVLDTSTETYKDVLRASAPFTISIRVWGFDTVKPWQPFDITDTTGKLSELTGRTYRPVELSYNIDNTIEITAYQIA